MSTNKFRESTFWLRDALRDVGRSVRHANEEQPDKRLVREFSKLTKAIGNFNSYVDKKGLTKF